AVALVFALHADRAEHELFSALFTEDATFERKGEVLRGRAAILAAQKLRPPGLRTRHHCLTPWITVLDAERATGITYFTTYRFEGQEEVNGPVAFSGPDAVGEFYDTFVRTPAGWKISTRKVAVAFKRVAQTNQ
ncbi:MAG: nuclear transport factor 2 family protein, partial [Desulfobacterales bacterium]|nr:nuclear transport factor 2 family protein [Desulfobacterales bacterium]